MRFPPGPGLGLFGTVFTDILAGIVFIILFVIAVGVLFVLVRFLWVATRAAELYIARNEYTHHAADPEPVTKPVATPAASAPAATKPTATTTPRARATKTPPPAS